jgi:hypothetical protein
LVFYMELWRRKEKLQWLVCGGSSWVCHNIVGEDPLL